MLSSIVSLCFNVASNVGCCLVWQSLSVGIQWTLKRSQSLAAFPATKWLLQTLSFFNLSAVISLRLIEEIHSLCQIVVSSSNCSPWFCDHWRNSRESDNFAFWLPKIHIGVFWIINHESNRTTKNPILTRRNTDRTDFIYITARICIEGAALHQYCFHF